MIEQTTLQIAFMGIVAQREEIEILRVFRNVPCQIGLRRKYRAIEIRNRLVFTPLDRVKTLSKVGALESLGLALSEKQIPQDC